MSTKIKSKPLEIVLKDGKPSAVILDIDEYQEMLERFRRYGGFKNAGGNA